MHPVVLLIGRRIVLGVVTLWAVSLLVFAGTEILPGDVAEAMLGQSATPEAVAAIRRELGLDRPAWERYLDWLLGMLRGDFGLSYANRMPVADLVADRLANTLFLAGVAAALAVPVAVTLGVLAVRWRETPLDRFISVTTLSAISMPEFFIGYALVYLFAITLPLAPPIASVHPGMDLLERLRAVALPVVTLAMVTVGHMMRMTRAAVLNVMDSPYIETAELKGLRRMRIVLRHALPNALSPIINVIVINLAYLVVGVVVVEVVFVYPGLGQLMVDAVSKRDVPLVQACGMIFAATYVLLNLVADVLAIVTNPRLLHPR